MRKLQTHAGYDALKSAILAAEPPAADTAFAWRTRLDGAIAVYRNNVRAAYFRVLRDAFPVVHKLVGDSFFRRMAHDYFLQHPPSSRLVARYGDLLPDFIAGYHPCAGLPYLPDVARFELLWLQSYHAPEDVALAPDVIERRLAVDPDQAGIRLHASARFFSSGFPVSRIWRNNRSDDPAPMSVRPTQEYLLLVRPEEDVRAIDLSRGAFQTLKAIENGAALGEALAAGAQSQEDLTMILQQIFAAIVIADITNT